MAAGYNGSETQGYKNPNVQVLFAQLPIGRDCPLASRTGLRVFLKPLKPEDTLRLSNLTDVSSL